MAALRLRGQVSCGGGHPLQRSTGSPHRPPRPPPAGPQATATTLQGLRRRAGKLGEGVLADQQIRSGYQVFCRLRCNNLFIVMKRLELTLRVGIRRNRTDL